MAKRIKKEDPGCGLQHHFFHISDNYAPFDAEKECNKPPPLTGEEISKVKRNVALMREHVPEAEAFIKELLKEGMIDGYRAIVSVGKRKIK